MSEPEPKDGGGEPEVFAPPEPLADDHDLTAFDCGENVLDDWLRKRAARNERGGFSRTYVVTRPGSRTVVAYYSLAAGGVSRSDAPGRVKRNAPDPIPVMVLGRLAVDRSAQGAGLGRRLVRDAILRTGRAAELAGVRAIVVDALHERAAAFYHALGFAPAPHDPLVLFLPVLKTDG